MKRIVNTMPKPTSSAPEQPKVCADCGLSHTQLMARARHDPKVRDQAAKDLAKNFGGTTAEAYQAIERAQRRLEDGSN